jgi:hypothetical protein
MIIAKIKPASWGQVISHRPREEAAPVVEVPKGIGGLQV